MMVLLKSMFIAISLCLTLTVWIGKCQLGIRCTAYYDVSNLILVSAVMQSIYIVKQDPFTKQLLIRYKNFVTWQPQTAYLPLRIPTNLTVNFLDGTLVVHDNIARPTGEFDHIFIYNDKAGTVILYIIGMSAQQTVRIEPLNASQAICKYRYAESYLYYWKYCQDLPTSTFKIERYHVYNSNALASVYFKNKLVFSSYHKQTDRIIAALFSYGTSKVPVYILHYYYANLTLQKQVQLQLQQNVTFRFVNQNYLIVSGTALPTEIICLDLEALQQMWRVDLKQIYLLGEPRGDNILIGTIASLFLINLNGQILSRMSYLNNYILTYTYGNADLFETYQNSAKISSNFYRLSDMCSPTFKCDVNSTCTFPIIASECFNYTETGLCLQFCHFSCAKCKGSANFCTECRTKMYDLSIDGKCTLNTRSQAVSSASSSLNTIKVNALLPVFFFMQRLQLYNYHQQNYEDTMSDVLSFIDTIKQKEWNVLSLGRVQEWLDMPYVLPSYIGFTDAKFLRIERKDCLFVQNTKDYFAVYLPLTLAFFVILNRLFHCLAHYPISAFLRDYSFWLQLWLVSVVQNLSSLWFFCLKELHVLFSLSSIMVLVRMATVPFIGLIFIGSVSLFFLCRSLYGSCACYFFINTRDSRTNSSYMLVRYILKPLIETAIHVFLTEETKSLLLALSTSSLFTIIIMVALEIKLKIHRYKTIFALDCLLQFSVICLNFLLIIKYCEQGSTISTLVQDTFSVFTVLCLIAFCQFFSFFTNLIFSLFGLELKNVQIKKIKGQQNNSTPKNISKVVSNKSQRTKQQSTKQTIKFPSKQPKNKQILIIARLYNKKTQANLQSKPN